MDYRISPEGSPGDEDTPFFIHDSASYIREQENEENRQRERAQKYQIPVVSDNRLYQNVPLMSDQEVRTHMMIQIQCNHFRGFII